MAAGQARVALFKTVGAVMEALPERLDLGLAMAIAQGVGHRHRSARANLTANLRHVLATAGEPVDDAVLDEFVERGFRSYGQYWAEGAKLPGVKPARVFERFVVAEGLEHLYAAKERGKGLIIALPHIGSWEWGGSYLNSLGLGMTAVAEELEPPALFQWFKEKRESIGIRVEPLNEKAGATLLSTLRAGGVVGLLCDRDIQGNGVEVNFFSERVTMPGGTGHAGAAHRSDARRSRLLLGARARSLRGRHRADRYRAHGQAP